MKLRKKKHLEAYPEYYLSKIKKMGFTEVEIINNNGEMGKIEICNELYGILKYFKHLIDKNFDCIILVTGSTGSGKSTLAQTIGAVWESFFNRQFSLNQIIFNVEELTDYTNSENNKTTAIIYDEAIQGTTTRETNGKAGIKLRNILTTKRRKKHLYLFLVDDINEFSKKIIQKAKCLLNVNVLNYYNKKEQELKLLERGNFEIFGPKTVREIYYRLKEGTIRDLSDYKRHKDFFRFKDYSNVIVDEEEYNIKKIESTSQEEENGLNKRQTKKFQKWDNGLSKLLYYIVTNHINPETNKKYTLRNLEKITGIENPTISQLINKIKQG